MSPIQKRSDKPNTLPSHHESKTSQKMEALAHQLAVCVSCHQHSFCADFPAHRGAAPIAQNTHPHAHSCAFDGHLHSFVAQKVLELDYSMI